MTRLITPTKLLPPLEYPIRRCERCEVGAHEMRECWWCESEGPFIGHYDGLGTKLQPWGTIDELLAA